MLRGKAGVEQDRAYGKKGMGLKKIVYEYPGKDAYQTSCRPTGISYAEEDSRGHILEETISSQTVRLS
jgi:hypothetical protein